jgi:hypothetical protein
MRKVLVKITNGMGWYAGLENEVFEVYDNNSYYLLAEDYDLGNKDKWLIRRYIDKADCEEIVTT